MLVFKYLDSANTYRDCQATVSFPAKNAADQPVPLFLHRPSSACFLPPRIKKGTYQQPPDHPSRRDLRSTRVPHSSVKYRSIPQQDPWISVSMGLHYGMAVNSSVERVCMYDLFSVSTGFTVPTYPNAIFRKSERLRVYGITGK